MVSQKSPIFSKFLYDFVFFAGQKLTDFTNSGDTKNGQPLAHYFEKMCGCFRWP